MSSKLKQPTQFSAATKGPTGAGPVPVKPSFQEQNQRRDSDNSIDDCDFDDTDENVV